MEKIKRRRQLGRQAAEFQLMARHTEKAINRIDYIYVDWVFSIGHFHCRISRRNRLVNYLCGAMFQVVGSSSSERGCRPCPTDRLLI